MSEIISEYIFNKAKSCAFTGHRTIYNDLTRQRLKNIILELIETGYDTFLIGMAIGFDTLAFNILEEIRQEKYIKIIACVPCYNQSLKFSVAQKIEYDRMIDSADYVIYTGKEYTTKCMKIRNEFMVNNSSALVCYLRRQYGGTYSTVKYAVNKNINIIKL